ncbi:M50 family metallopeptidase [Pseudonocardia sp. CA-107938]|uniref:M50 family metallopeptidase n=1 Tax=Pseudonocardia sp. CA-107938 TaxID=3240021 RepID=UPI003D8D4F10
MMTVLGIVLFFLGILLSVAWHELGHLLAAKRFGIKVPEFFVGFGRTLWSVKRGETEYGVKLVPLGGYIRMIGMIPPARGEGMLGSSRRTGPFQSLIDDVRSQSASEVRPEDVERQFWTRAPWKRVVVMFAGPFMNLVLAVLIFTFSLMVIGAPTGTNTTVSAVSKCVVPATATTAVCPPDAPLTPAAAAGFQAGDRIVSFQGRPYAPDQWGDLQKAIRAASGTVTVVVDRGGQQVELHPTLVTTDLPDLDNPKAIVRGSFLGLSPVTFYEPQGFGVVVDRIGDVIARTGEAIVALPQRVPGLFGAVFLGEKRDQDSPVGVVGASRLGGQILDQDLPVKTEISIFLNLLALVNISLFLFNLLPIPPLDGGQIFPAIWEGIRRRIAKLRGKPDPGPVDVARLMPFAYVVALVFVAWSGLLFVADIINPVTIN